MTTRFISTAGLGPNLVQLAVSDLAAASAILGKPRGAVLGLDVRELQGGASAQAAGPKAFDTYLGAIDAGLARLPGLTNRGYVLRRAAVKR